jgi:hypothetical protein
VALGGASCMLMRTLVLECARALVVLVLLVLVLVLAVVVTIIARTEAAHRRRITN